MKITFTEARILPGGERVAAGAERDFDQDEAAAFVRNGVAEFSGTKDPGNKHTEVNE